MTPMRLALLTLLLCLTSACESFDKKGQSESATASVKTRDVDGLRNTAVEEFRKDGFIVLEPGPTKGSLVFEREATRMERISYADLRGGRLVNRATLSFIPSGNTTEMRLRSVLINKPDTSFATYHYPVFGTRSSYRNLLNRTKTRVESGDIARASNDLMTRSLDLPLIPLDDYPESTNNEFFDNSELDALPEYHTDSFIPPRYPE